MTNRIDLQNKEFDALETLIKKYTALTKCAVVDDDYPEMRHYYESAIKDFLEACKSNGRI